MDPNVSKTTTVKERVVASCAESQSTSRVPNRTRFLTVQTTIRTKMQCDKKSLLAVADASKKRNLMVVGGHADNAVDLCGEDSAGFSHDYHLTLVECIKPQDTQSVCTTREKETDRDTFFF
jgi:hypothetical protein